MRHLIVMLTLAAAPSQAGTYTADAFGLAPQNVDETTRTAWSGLRVFSDVESTIEPGNADRILIVVGPKSIVAGKDKGHAVALVLDRLGNPVADGTQVQFRIGEETVDVVTTDGLADKVFVAPPIAGEIIVGATSGTRQSTRAMVRVVPDIGSIQPELRGIDETVAHEAFFNVATAELRDRFGNKAEDGTAVTVTLQHADGSFSQSTGIASKGDVSARFLSRDIAGTTSVSTALGQNKSPDGAFSISRPRAMRPPEVILTPIADIEAMQFAIGPFMTEDGYALPDGAPVTIDVLDNGGQQHTVSTWMRDGYVSAMLPVPSNDSIEGLVVTSPLGRMELEGQLADTQYLEIMQ